MEEEDLYSHCYVDEAPVDAVWPGFFLRCVTEEDLYSHCYVNEAPVDAVWPGFFLRWVMGEKELHKVDVIKIRSQYMQSGQFGQNEKWRDEAQWVGVREVMCDREDRKNFEEARICATYRWG